MADPFTAIHEPLNATVREELWRLARQNNPNGLEAQQEATAVADFLVITRAYSPRYVAGLGARLLIMAIVCYLHDWGWGH